MGGGETLFEKWFTIDFLYPLYIPIGKPLRKLLNLKLNFGHGVLSLSNLTSGMEFSLPN